MMASNARQSDDASPYVMEISIIHPQKSDTIWQFKPNLPFFTHPPLLMASVSNSVAHQ